MKALEHLFAILHYFFVAAGELCWSGKEILREIRESREPDEEPEQKRKKRKG